MTVHCKFTAKFAGSKVANTFCCIFTGEYILYSYSTFCCKTLTVYTTVDLQHLDILYSYSTFFCKRLTVYTTVDLQHLDILYSYSTFFCRVSAVFTTVNLQHLKYCIFTAKCIGNFAASKICCKFTVFTLYSVVIGSLTPNL